MREIMKKLMKLDGAVKGEVNPFLNVIQTTSPSVNWLFGKGHGLPLGYGLCLFGGPKGGKSLISYSMIGQLHASDPDAIVVRFDTEHRTRVQLTPQTAKAFGIDMGRVVSIENNNADIFDMIATDIKAACQDKNADGKIKMIVIDSLNNIVGRRTANADTVNQQQIGDLALTLQDGLKQILQVVRNNNIALVLVCQVRAEMDPMEIRRGNTVKMAAPYYVRHFAEYFMFVEEIKGKAGGLDYLENPLVNTSVTDFMDKNEKTGHKIRAKMVGQSMGGCRDRVAEFTVDYRHGIVHQHEEVFVLGINRNVIERPNNQMYRFDGKEWRGAPAMLEAIKGDPAMAKSILNEVYKQDLSLDGWGTGESGE